MSDVLNPANTGRFANEQGLWASGIENPPDSFLTGAVAPIDPYLDFLTGNGVLGYESEDPFSFYRLSLSGSAANVLTRYYGPAHPLLKLGPLYLDIPHVSGTLIYNSYNSAQPHQSDHGWIGMIDTRVRAMAQLTDTLYLSLSASFFVTTGGRLGFSFLDQSPVYLQLAYEAEIADWKLVLYNRADILNPYLLELGESSYDSVGRVSIGRPIGESRVNTLFDGSQALLRNTAGIVASRSLVDYWKLSLGFARTDTWSIAGPSYQSDLNRFFGALSYVRPDWKWTPYLLYQMLGRENFENRYHMAHLGVRGQITPEITLSGKIGYVYEDERHHDGRGSVDVMAVLAQRLTPYTLHWLRAGYGYMEDVYGDPEIGGYAGYSIRHVLAPNLAVMAGARWSAVYRDENPDDDFRRENVVQLDSGFSYGITQSLGLHGNYIFQRRDYNHHQLWQRRNIVRANLRYRIAVDWSATATYQYEDSRSESRSRTYDDHLLMLRITKYF